MYKSANLSVYLLALICAFAWVPVEPLLAQETAPVPSEAAAPTEGAAKGGTHDKSFWEVVKEGGPVMVVLALAWVLMLGFIIEGIMKLRNAKLAPPALVAQLKSTIASGNYQEAWTICKANKCFLSNVLSAGLERIGRSRDAVDFSIQETSMKESTMLKTNTTYLSVIGVVTPMIGLTGTVIGMIKAFATLGANGIGDPSKLASAIGEVLVCTAGGLIIAIPAFVFYYYLKAKAQNVILYAETEVYKLLEDVPYDQVAGLKIGENFSGGIAAGAKRNAVSNKVSMSLTTNCPVCNFRISPGTSPCPNCGSPLEWGA
jgi:biopolymer transport protein ExbB